MKLIKAAGAPEAIGPYAQAIEVNGVVYCSGQLPISPASGKIEADGVAEQALQALLNLRAVLEAAGASLQSVVKTTVFLTDIGDFPVVNTIYAEMFAGHTPARSTVQVARLPKGAKIEIEAVAVK